MAVTLPNLTAYSVSGLVQDLLDADDPAQFVADNRNNFEQVVEMLDGWLAAEFWRPGAPTEEQAQALMDELRQTEGTPADGPQG